MLTSYPLHKDVTQTVEGIHPSTLSGLPSAVIGKQEIVQKQKNVIFTTILTHTQSNNIWPRLMRQMTQPRGGTGVSKQRDDKWKTMQVMISTLNAVINWLRVFIQSSKGHELNQEFEPETFPSTQTPVCSYWEAGDCARGEHCRFLHDPKV